MDRKKHYDLSSYGLEVPYDIRHPRRLTHTHTYTHTPGGHGIYGQGGHEGWVRQPHMHGLHDHG